ITLVFFAAGLAYGRGAGTITSKEEVIATITKSWAGLAGLLFLFLLIAQFIAYFNFSNMAEVAAVKLGDVLEHMNIGAVWLLIGFIIVTVIVDLIIPQAIAKWALLAPIFIPLFIRLNVAPQTVLAAYRVGDSPFNVLTPLMAYFPLIVIFAKRYRKDAGIGTVVSLMLPYAIVLSILWTLFFVVWYLIGIPLGPGSPVHTYPPAARSATASSERCERHHHHLPRTGRGRRRLRLGPPAGRGRRPGHGADAVGDRGAHPRPVARRFRRPDGDLHRLAVRRQRGARRDRDHRLAGTGTDRPRGGQPFAGDRVHLAAGRRADRADQRERLGRSASARRRRDGGATPALPFPPAYAP